MTTTAPPRNAFRIDNSSRASKPSSSRSAALPRRQAAAVDRALRLLLILQGLQSRPPDEPVTTITLANECQCSSRTIRRDIDLLRERFDIDYNAREHTYTLAPNTLPPLAHLSVNDARNLGLLRRLLCLPGMPQNGNILGTLDKVIALLPAEQQRTAHGLEQTIALSSLPRDYSQAPIALLHSAIERQVTVRIDYESRRSKRRSWRQVDPYKVEPRAGTYWELHGWCHENRQFLTFALDRVHQVEGTTVRFRERQQEWQDFIGRGTVGGLRGDSTRMIDVNVAFASPVAPYVPQYHAWPSTLTFTTQADGGILMTGSISSGEPLIRLVSLLLSFRSHARIKGGEELLDAYRTELRLMAENHGLLLR